MLIIVWVKSKKFENIFLVRHCLATVSRPASHLSTNSSCLVFAKLQIAIEVTATVR